jgi:CheY-like chemotaxis protein
MCRILFVEDEGPTREWACDLFRLAIPDVQITEAKSFEDAEAKIAACVVAAEGFDVIILDSQLPRAGEQTITMELCDLASKHFPDALFLHVTAYSEDPAVRKHLKERHLKGGRDAPRAYLVEKNTDWPEQLLARILGDSVENAMDAFFSRPRRSARSVQQRGSATLQLAGLMAEIERSWCYLPDETKARVREQFEVNEKTIPVSVTLGSENAD